MGVTKTRDGKLNGEGNGMENGMEWKGNGMENGMKRKICNVIYVYLRKTYIHYL